MSDEIPRYGGWYKHSNPNYEDFEMWNSVCEDAEPDWEYRNSQRAEREDREREERAAARRDQERREQEAREKRAKEEKERKEVEAILAIARRENAKWQQQRKEAEAWKAIKDMEEQKRKERETREALESELAKKTELVASLSRQLAVLLRNKDTQGTQYEEEDAVLGAEDDRDQTQ